MAQDTCVCPGCQTVLDVGEYGRGMKCSECGCKMDVWPDTSLLIDTPIGMIGISLLNNSSDVLRYLFK